MASTDRIDIALEKLTEISGELKAMIAVHEQRLNQQEKETDEIHHTLEKRRDEVDIKLKDVYDTMRDQDNNIIECLNQLRKESTDQHKSLNEKIGKLEKFIWVAIGGGMVLVWLLSNISTYFKLFGH
jgi:DNA anti-recombination protein RmuC